MVELILYTYLSAVSVYALVFSVAGAVSKKKRGFPVIWKQNRFAVLIPAYKEDAVIINVAEKAIKQQYPSSNYDVVIIADSLQADTLEKLSQLPVKVIEVQFEKSTKVKALRTALEQLPEAYDIAVILDADNVMEDQFLHKINQAHHQGFEVIQARRAAKNLNTSFAVLDALSEIINNHIHRKGSQALGLSSPLIGSGMAFPYRVLKNALLEIQAVGGFDRELQVKMVKQGYRITYWDEAVVLDEKVAKANVFGNQRRRWLSSQFIYARKFFKEGVKGLMKGNFDLFHITVLNNVQLPRILNLGLMGVGFVLSVLFPTFLDMAYPYWLLLIGLNLIAMMVAVPVKFYDRRFFKALMSLPKAFFIMGRSLFKLKGANKEFIHTPHTT